METFPVFAGSPAMLSIIPFSKKKLKFILRTLVKSIFIWGEKGFSFNNVYG